MGPLQKESGDLVAQDMEKVEALSFLPQSSLSGALATLPKSQKTKAGTGSMKKCSA